MDAPIPARTPNTMGAIGTPPAISTQAPVNGTHRGMGAST